MLTVKITPRKILQDKTILIVEDDLMILRVYTKWLTNAGAVVIEAHDGVQGLRMLSSQPVDIVLLDLGMPGLNGYDTLKQIRQNPSLEKLPVIVLSNTTLKKSDKRFEELAQEGVKHTLRKYETSLKEIVECINSYF